MRLSEILHGNDDLQKLFAETEAAGELTPLPAGEYVAHIVDGELESSRTNGTPGYKLTFQVVEGEFKGRKFWADCWLTPAAMPQTKRDLAKIGVTSLEQLENPLPRFIRCKCKLALRRDDDGNERNRLKSFEVVGIDAPEVDTFAPVATPTPAANEPTTSEPLNRVATKAVNMKTEAFDVRIDRETKWGNPFVIGTHGDRSEVIEKFREWLPTQDHLKNSLGELRGKRLGCHCKPLACHGDILAELADAIETAATPAIEGGDDVPF